MGLFSGVIDLFKIGNAARLPSDSLDLVKSEPARESRAIIEDPLALLTSLKYKDRPFSLSYDILKKMSARNAVVSSIITTRINQISTFSRPARFSRDGIGFEIRLRDPKRDPDSRQRRVMQALELFLEHCGFEYSPDRDSFDTFLRKILRDSLMYDQLTFEIVPDRLNRPSEFYATDAATFRSAFMDTVDYSEGVTNSMIAKQRIKWVQILNGRILGEFTGEELVFAVRNPRTDILIQPYGFSELEQLIHQVTAHLWAEEYNSRYFSNGGTTKGILNLKGTNIGKEQLEAFRRQWVAQVSGLTGAWKTPVVSVEGLEYINVSQSNRDMEYEMWMNYLINIASAVYQIDPAEINFPNRGGAGGGGSSGIMEGGMENRLKNSKDKGLRPLLRFLEDVINRSLIYRFSREFVFNFVGLDQETEHDRAELNEKLVRTRKTINEVRKENDEPPIKGGDIILDPTYTNYIIQLQQEKDMQQQQQGQDGSNEDQLSTDQYGNTVDQDGTPVDDSGKPLNDDQFQETQENNQISDAIDQQYNKSRLFEDLSKSENYINDISLVVDNI